MGHTKPKDLQDLQELLAEIRSWEGIREKSANVFYLRAKPFLHFHDKSGARWADVATPQGWGKPLPLSFQATSVDKADFLRQTRARYEKFLQPKQR